MITCFWILVLFIGLSYEDITPDIKISIEVPSKEYIRTYPNNTINMYVRKGSNMVIECVIFNKPPTGNLLWKKYPYNGDKKNVPIQINKGLVSYDLSRYRIGQGKQTDSNRLEILTVDESYAGIYSCEYMYSANVINAKVERTLMIYDLPQITYTEYKNNVETGKDITLTCTAYGIPLPSVVWKRIGGYTNIIKNTGVVLYSNQVTLTKVTYADSGMYACYAENEWGSEERKFSISVSHAPVITITPNGNDAYQIIGCMVQLTCIVKGNPSPEINQIIWASNTSGTIITGGRFTVKVLRSIGQDVISFLRIYPTTMQDVSYISYSCSATNALGSGSNSISFRASSISNPLITGPYPCGTMGLHFSILIISISLTSLFISIKSLL